MSNSLAAQYSALSDTEMLELGQQYASLTDEAQSLVRSEFARRKLEIPDAPEDPDAVEFQNMKTIRRYRDQPEALLARSVLESAGIPCFLRDENTIRIEWVWSNYMGGMRLQVAESDLAAAEEVLSQPIPETIAIPGESDYDQPHCPNCGSLDTTYTDLDAKVAATSLLLVGVPLPNPFEKHFWHCNNCSTNWQDDALNPSE